MMLGGVVMVVAVLVGLWLTWSVYRHTRSWRIAVTVFAAVIGLAAMVVDAYMPPKPFMCLYKRIDRTPLICIDILDIIQIKATGLILAVNADKISRLLKWP